MFSLKIFKFSWLKIGPTKSHFAVPPKMATAEARAAEKRSSCRRNHSWADGESWAISLCFFIPGIRIDCLLGLRHWFADCHQSRGFWQ